MNELILETSSDRVSVSSFFPSLTLAAQPSPQRCQSVLQEAPAITPSLWQTATRWQLPPSSLQTYLAIRSPEVARTERRGNWESENWGQTSCSGRLLLQFTYFYFASFLLLIMTINNHYKRPIRIWLKNLLLNLEIYNIYIISYNTLIIQMKNVLYLHLILKGNFLYIFNHK